MIPIICSLLFRLGGWGRGDRFVDFLPQPTCGGNKLFRWLGIGLFVGVTYAILRHSWMPLLSIATYYIATSIPYGDNDKNWIRKLVGREVNWLLYGLCFGLSSFFVLSFGLCLVQGIIGAISFWTLMTLSNKGIVIEKKDEEHGRIGWTWHLSHPYVELGIGFLGTILLW